MSGTYAAHRQPKEVSDDPPLFDPEQPSPCCKAVVDRFPDAPRALVCSVCGAFLGVSSYEVNYPLLLSLL